MRNLPDSYLLTLQQHFPAAPAFTLDKDNGWVSTPAAQDCPPATTHQAAQETAFQRWFHFKEAFSPSFVTTAIETLGYRPDHVIDPFGGSGTTAITCQLLGINATTIEVNPFLADVIRAKTSIVNADTLAEAAKTFQRRLSRIKPDLSVFDQLPPTFIESQAKDRWIFSEAFSLRLSQYLQCIRRIADKDVQRYFKVALGSVLIECSNVYINGKGRRYRGSWHETQASAEILDTRFKEQLKIVFEDVQRFAERPSTEMRVINDDSRTAMQRLDKPADLIVFSPPYPNSFDYTDIYNVELWVLGYLSSTADNALLRRSTVHSHVQIQRLGNKPINYSPTLDVTAKELEKKIDELWDSRIPEMVSGYFRDLEQILLESFRLLTARGKVLMVVGDSRYAGTLVDVPTILVELAKAIGYTKTRIFEVRKMRSSAQQGGSLHLKECIVELAK